MATHKTKAHITDLTWLPTQDTCCFCKKTIELLGPFDGLFGGNQRIDGTKADDYEEWHLPCISMLRACKTCVPADGFELEIEQKTYRLVPGNPSPVRL